MLPIDIDYQASPAFLSPFMAEKMKCLIKDVLLGYKHYSETDKKYFPIQSIKNRIRIPILEIPILLSQLIAFINELHQGNNLKYHVRMVSTA